MRLMGRLVPGNLTGQVEIDGDGHAVFRPLPPAVRLDRTRRRHERFLAPDLSPHA